MARVAVVTGGTRGIGEAIRGNSGASKVLVLNGHNDRETGGFCAMEYVRSVANALDGYRRSDEQCDGDGSSAAAAVEAAAGNVESARAKKGHVVVSRYVNIVVVLESGKVPWSPDALQAHGIKIIVVPKSEEGKDFSQAAAPRYRAEVLAQTLAGIAACSRA